MAHRRPHILIAVLVMSVCHWSLAQSLTIHDAVQRAVHRHPQLAVAKSDIAIAQARLIDAGKLENPVLEFSLTSQIKDGPDREGALFVGYSQIFPVTDKLLRQRDLGVADVQVACAEVIEVERNLIARVQEQYIRALGALALIDEAKRIESSAQNGIDQARRQMAAAMGSELDVAAAETEKVLASQDRVLAQGRYRQAIAGLRQLIGVSTNQPISLSNSLPTVIGGLDKTTKPYLSSNQIKRADVVAAELRKQRAIADHELALSETLEDWEFIAGYEGSRTVDEPIGVERERSIALGFKVPIPVRKQGEGRIAETQARSVKVDHEIAVIKAKQYSEVTAALAEVQAAKLTRSNLQSRVLPQLKSRERKTLQAYEQGLVKFNQIILLRQQQTRIQKAATQARVNEALALARLQHALGSHPALKSYDPCLCPPYKPGTEPESEAWTLDELKETKVARAIQAIPVPKSKNDGLKKLGQKLFRKQSSK